MHERDLGADLVPANLLVSAERHLPCRKGEKDDAVRFQIHFQPLEKCVFSFRFNMFNDIVYENDVEESVFLERIGFQEVRAGKLPFRFECGEKFPGIVNLACCEIQSGYLASCLRERQEISAFAASDFQDFTAGANVLVRFQIINVEFFRRLRQFIEIPLSVYVSILHFILVILLSCIRPGSCLWTI